MAEAAKTVTPKGPAPFVPKIIKKLTFQVLKFEIDVPKFVKITGKIYIAKDTKSRTDKAGTAKKEPPHLCEAIDLETGEAGLLVLGTVLYGTLDDEYPSAAYVGKGFMITKRAKASGREYNAYDLAEIAV